MSKLKNLTRAELADAVFRRLGVTQTEANRLVDQLLDEMTQAMVGGGAVKVAGFGTFTAKMMGKRIGRNPKTGEEVAIEPHYAARFKPSQELRERVDVSLKNLKGLPR